MDGSLCGCKAPSTELQSGARKEGRVPWVCSLSTGNIHRHTGQKEQDLGSGWSWALLGGGGVGMKFWLPGGRGGWAGVRICLPPLLRDVKDLSVPSPV
jgi:hypothetical protein